MRLMISIREHDNPQSTINITCSLVSCTNRHFSLGNLRTRGRKVEGDKYARRVDNYVLYLNLT